MNLLTWLGAAALGACPYLAEILPDPEDVDDSRGEFVEIRLPQTPWHDTLSVYFEQKLIWKGTVLEPAKRLLLIRDTSLCPTSKKLACEALLGKGFPNSRSSEYSLWSGACNDSAALPKPKPGKSFVRTDSSFDSWTFAEASPGLPNAYLEEDVQDCRIEIDTVFFSASGWKGFWTLTGCDSAWVKALFRSTASLTENAWQGDLTRGSRKEFSTHISSDALQIQVFLPPDDIPANDSLDTLIAKPGAFPIRITEVHPCPEEGSPEWIEIYNAGARELSLSLMNLCSEKTFLTGAVLQKHESAVLVKDTALMRTFVGNDDVKILPMNFGYLKNAADTLFLCQGSSPVDSVIWGRNARISPHCPQGFSAATGRTENSPGFQTPGSLAASAEKSKAPPFSVEWNARLFSKRNPSKALMLRVRSESAVSEVLVELISGKGDLLWSTKLSVDPSGNSWSEIPLHQKGFLGVNFLRISQGAFEKRIGLVLRP